MALVEFSKRKPQSSRRNRRLRAHGSRVEDLSSAQVWANAPRSERGDVGLAEFLQLLESIDRRLEHATYAVIGSRYAVREHFMALDRSLRLDVVGRALFPVVVAVKILLFYVFFPRYENSG